MGRVVGSDVRAEIDGRGRCRSLSLYALEIAELTPDVILAAGAARP